MDQRWSNTGNTRPYWQVAISLLFSVLATVAFIYLGWKLILFFIPFVVGWGIAMIVHPIVAWLDNRFKIVKKVASALIVIAVLAAVVALIYFLLSRLITEVSSLMKDSANLYAQAEAGFDKVGRNLSGVYERLPKGIQSALSSIMANFDKSTTSLVEKFSQPTVDAAGRVAKSLPSILISVLVSILSAYFFIVQKDQVVEWAKRMAPPSVEKRMSFVISNLKTAVGGYFKAQFEIMGIVVIILFVSLTFLGVDYAIIVALLIGFLDFLPFFGTGTAMIPWALYKIVVGDYKMAVGLFVIYAITQAVHQLLQPKLIGDSVGLNPLVTLVLIYIGYRLGSVVGMILAVPVGMVVINMVQAGAFDYILDDISILVEGILHLREE